MLRRAAIFAAIALAYAVPQFVTQPYALTVLILSMLYAIPSVGLNLMLGGAGMISLGHMGFAGIGGYAAATLLVDQHWNFWLALAAGTALAGAIGGLIGACCLHLRSHYFIIVTLAAGVILFSVFNNWDQVTHGAEGFPGIPRPLPISLLGWRFDFRRLPDFYLLTLSMLMLVMGIQALIMRSDFGRGLRAVRQDEALAAARGLNVFATKLAIFVIGSAMAGFGGVLKVSFVRVAAPSMFDMQESVNLILITIAGGAGFQFGPILGALLFSGVPEYLRIAREYRFVFFGALLVLITLVMPEGIAGLGARGRRRWLAWRAAHAA